MSTNGRYRHKKRGTTYDVLGVARVQASTSRLHEGDQVVVYRSTENGLMFVRRTREFNDGRFEKVCDERN